MTAGYIQMAQQRAVVGDGPDDASVTRRTSQGK